MFGGTIYDKPNTLIRKTMQRSTNIDSHLPHCFFSYIEIHILLTNWENNSRRWKKTKRKTCWIHQLLCFKYSKNWHWNWKFALKFSLLSKSHSISIFAIYSKHFAILPVVRATVFNYSLSNKMCNKSFIIYYTMWIKQ